MVKPGDSERTGRGSCGSIESTIVLSRNNWASTSCSVVAQSILVSLSSSSVWRTKVLAVETWAVLRDSKSMRFLCRKPAPPWSIFRRLNPDSIALIHGLRSRVGNRVAPKDGMSVPIIFCIFGGSFFSSE